jgi:energy-coupling factor transporter ATP-binding protein EcfA2
MRSETSDIFVEQQIPTNPFPGLRPFDFEESHLFFGRDGQSEQLITKLGATRFLAVVGTSGSGKSSLVRAGLMPSLLGGFMTSAGSNWRIAVMRPGNDPIGNLARVLNAPDVFGSDITENAELQTVLAEATLHRGSRGLVDAVRQAVIGENENLLVVVDQFEEIFRFARVSEEKEYRDEAAAFVKLLLEAMRQREVSIYVVLTMRSDYLGDCSQFWGLPEAINESQYLIPRLTRDQLKEAITGPISVGQGQITPRLVARLLNDVGDNQDQLPVLQHLLMRVWDECKDQQLSVEISQNGKSTTKPHRTVHTGAALDLCCYDAVGGMGEALSRHADEALAELPGANAQLTAGNAQSLIVAEKLFKALTEKGTGQS